MLLNFFIRKNLDLDGKMSIMFRCFYLINKLVIKIYQHKRQ